MIFKFNLFENSSLSKHPIGILLEDFLKSNSYDFDKLHNESLSKTNKNKNFKEINYDLIPQNQNIENNEEEIYCFRCRASSKEISIDRGQNSFMMPILKNGVNNGFICDLCLMGW